MMISGPSKLACEGATKIMNEVHDMMISGPSKLACEDTTRIIIERKGVFSMEDTSQKHINIGLVAHVDAGKTTLSEGVLFAAGNIQELGRVDNQDAFLDTDDIERERGITIFSKQAEFAYGDVAYTLLDTPGHVDFSAEMERTLQVLDYAILLVSGADGVQGHTVTLWRLLHRYQIPTFIFVNKMDQPGTDREKILAGLQEHFGERCVDFTHALACFRGREGDEDGVSPEDREAFFEHVAVNEEDWLEAFLEDGELSLDDILGGICDRKIFPCYFGSALRFEGVKEFLEGVGFFALEREYGEEFGAKVFKIARDGENQRLTYLKVTGGTLAVRQLVSGTVRLMADGEAGSDTWEEKVNQIRIYSGEKYEAADEVSAGTVCAVTGLTRTYAGQGLGAEEESDLPVLEPVLTYGVVLPEGFHANAFLPKLKEMEEEEPELKVLWDEELEEIQIQMMGEVQIEILRRKIRERFGVAIDFDQGRIVYKETIASVVEGVGHFEPLRHYAEAHLLIEPGEPGSGIQVGSRCSEDVLNRNWQRLICTHIAEREHRGVLVGGALTDVRITVVSGKAHLKHTEGGDFRQATYRAIRQGLMKAESVLLEPWFSFRLEIPAEMLGRAMTDLEKMHGKFDAPEQLGETSVLSGIAPVITMRNYQKEVQAYSQGRGHLSCQLKGYFPCHNQEEVVESVGYDPELDGANPTGSVFCSHGAGYVVPWEEVEEHMHVPLLTEDRGADAREDVPIRARRSGGESYFMGEEEVEQIIGKAFSANRKEGKRVPYKKRQKRRVEAVSRPAAPKKSGERYLLVDGYNIVFAWEELNRLAAESIDAARGRLMDILCNYQGYRKCTLILVFDAYKVKGNLGQMYDYHNIHVVYTKEAETADQYIEKLAHRMGDKHDVTVATSDGLEQLIIRGQGCKLLSARDFYEEVMRVEEEIRERL